MGQHLSVFIGDVYAGKLSQSDSGMRSFSYDAAYVGPPLSLSMPVSNRTFRGKVVDAYLFGLLPDDERVRREAGRRFSVSGNNPFALLAHMGLDCPGAIQICIAGNEDVLSRKEELRPLTVEEISMRLDPASGDQADTWFRTGERWSLGGNQSKFALRLENGVWYECGGSAATTHIFKPGIDGMRFEALDEYVTMRIASLCGLPTEEVAYREFCGTPAVIATRYDRTITPTGIRRIHQEDLCQALSVTPDKKYAEDGGPSTPDVIKVLGQTSEPQRAIETFAAMLFFNYLMGAPDAHAKNYSILHLGPSSCTIAPLYDVASGLPYDLAERGTLRMAMSIGGENRLGYVGRREIERFADSARLARSTCRNLMANLCERIVTYAPEVLTQTSEDGMKGSDELAERLLPRLESHCRKTLQML